MPEYEIELEVNYQILSSVIENTSTEMRETVGKSKTKVLAGGAVIAKQGENVNGNKNVVWIAADPVTGSSVELSKSVAFFDDDRKELEPLGQEVLPTEPPIEEQPPSNTNTTHTAEEPEFQCKAATALDRDFFALPVNCQKALWESVNLSDFSIESALLSANTEHNTNNIASAHDNPHSSSATASAMPVNITPTTKPQGTNGSRDSARAIPATSLPNASGATDIIATVQSERADEFNHAE